MNPDTTPTPRTEIYVLNPHPPCVSAEFARELERELAEKTNEVARLRNENDELKLSEAALSEQLKISDDWLKQTRNEVARLQAETDRLYIVAQEASESAQRKTNEVARLRELLESAIEELSGQAYTEISEAYAALAPAPEEPVIQDSRTIEPAPEWRELGPDEVICRGDEWYGSLYGVIAWHPVTDERIATCVGEKCGTNSGLFRTRRPLPVQEEMPLEGIIDTMIGYLETLKSELEGLENLRAEIQKLKEAR